MPDKSPDETAADVKAPVSPAIPDKPIAPPVTPVTLKQETTAAKSIGNTVENTVAPAVTPTEEATPVAPTGPRWFAVHTASQPAPVNVLIKECAAEMSANVDAAIERFKRGHGIISTPYEITAAILPEEFKPTAADIDYNNAID